MSEIHHHQNPELIICNTNSLNLSMQFQEPTEKERFDNLIGRTILMRMDIAMR